PPGGRAADAVDGCCTLPSASEAAVRGTDGTLLQSPSQVSEADFQGDGAAPAPMGHYDPFFALRHNPSRLTQPCAQGGGSESHNQEADSNQRQSDGLRPRAPPFTGFLTASSSGAGEAPPTSSQGAKAACRTARV